jgi:hypothetical protein
MLEAATRDVPILASRAYPGLSPLMSSMGPLDDVVVPAPDVSAYHAQLRRLVAEPALRASLGAATGAAVRARHGAAAWHENLAAIYRQAEGAEPVRARTAPDYAGDELAEYAELLLGIEKRAPLLWTIMYTREGFDAFDKTSSLVRTTAVRALQRVRGGALAGAAMGDLLIPQKGIG